MSKKKKSITTIDPHKSDTKTKGIFSYVAEDGKKYKLSLKEKTFCEMYLEFNGNGTDAIIEAGYDVSFSNGSGINRRLANTMASENLVKPKIYYYINTLLETSGFNDHNVTKQHTFLINQGADLSAKKGGVELYYKIKGKLMPERVEVRHILEDFDDLDNEEIAKASKKHTKT